MNRLNLAAVACLFGITAAFAQTPAKAPALPVNVEADQMEVRSAENIAIFTGKVDAKRGDTHMVSDRMTVHYAKRDAAATADPAASGLSGSEVTLIEAEGQVRIETPGQVVTGNSATLDVLTDMLTVTGAVTVTQGKSVIKGTRLVSDLKKKTSQMAGGRVSGSFVPGAQ
jgi:lipopolysaccharide export system protein LptA